MFFGRRPLLSKNESAPENVWFLKRLVKSWASVKQAFCFNTSIQLQIKIL